MTTLTVEKYRIAKKLVPGDAIDLYRTTARFTMRRADVDRSRSERAVVIGVTADSGTVRVDFTNYRPAYLRADDSIFVAHRTSLKEITA